MAAKKVYDLAIKVSSYTDNQGKEKGRYENVGSVLEMDDGGKMILLKRSFNPAGVPFKDGSDQIVISMFVPKDKDGQQSEHNEAKSNAYQKSTAAFDDTEDIGF